MAMYHCEECQELIDDDYHPCQEHPTKALGLICPDCFCNMQDDMEAEVNGEDYRKPRVPFARGQFTKEQQAIIKQAEMESCDG